VNGVAVSTPTSGFLNVDDGMLFVGPEAERTPGRIRWQSGPLALRFQICRAMREVVLGASPNVQLTRRAESALAETRTELAPVADSDGTLVVRDPAGDLRWWTWAGARANATIHSAHASPTGTEQKRCFERPIAPPWLAAIVRVPYISRTI
jgi:hypothetical protein